MVIQHYVFEPQNNNKHKYIVLTEIRKINEDEIEDVLQLMHLTISACYPSIYPKKVVDFFLSYHSKEVVYKRFCEGDIYLLKYKGTLRGTAFLVHNEMGGLYIHPEFQRKGFGKLLVEKLIESANEKRIKRVWLDATPLAKPLYLKLKFSIVSPMVDIVEDEELHYHKMEMIF